MSRPRTLTLAEPKRPPKEFCVNGHRLSEVGYTLTPCPRGDKMFVTRRCRRCNTDQSIKCQKLKRQMRR